MSIWAQIEVNKSEYLPLASDRTTSKAIAAFIGPLENYCFSLTSRSEPTNEEWLQDLVKWFTNVTSSMTENICLLIRATYGFWDYTEDEYERYVNSEKAAFEDAKNRGVPDWLQGTTRYEEYLHQVTNRALKVMPKEQFVEMCQDIEQKWTETIALKRCIDDLIRVIDEIHPMETWFYNAEDTLTDLRLFSEALASALQKGYKRVRIYCS